MNDQISADLQRLIGRVWMAAYEEGKREALAPKDPDTMRREALAAALAQDGADERVRGDWMAEGPMMVSVPLGTSVNYENGAMKIEPPADTTPIRRSDVRLKVGDVVVRRDGEGLTVVIVESYGAYPVRMSDGVGYMLNGYCYCDQRHPSDIVTINNRPIIED